jgi:hypothetical protein
LAHEQRALSEIVIESDPEDSEDSDEDSGVEAIIEETIAEPRPFFSRSLRRLINPSVSKAKAGVPDDRPISITALLKRPSPLVAGTQP